MTWHVRAAAVAAAALLLPACLAGCGPKPTASDNPPAAPAATPGGLAASGVVTEVTRPPRPGSVPYRDAIIAVHVAEVAAAGARIPAEVVVYTWGMRDNKLTPAADVGAGARVSLSLTPWEDVESKYGSVNRIELSDPDALALPAYWADRL